MRNQSILCAANWDSDVGYAWWLMESFWAKIGEHYDCEFDVILAYPSISKLPGVIKQSNLKMTELDFTFNNSSILKQLKFIVSNQVRYIYLSDRPSIHWRYLLYKLAGVRKIIVHEHTPGLRSKPAPMKLFLKEVLNNLPMISADGFIGATEFIRQRLININGINPNRCFTATNGIPIANSFNGLDVGSLQALGVPSERLVIVSTGRANLYKGVDFALETINVLVKDLRCRNAHYLYLGDGPDMDKILEMADELGINEFVTFPGRVMCVNKFLPSCSIAFHPSKGEVGYSLSILEYMQAGLPVVVSDNQSVCGATTHEEDGIIYKQDDIKAAARALKLLLDNPDLRKLMGVSASNKVKKHYSLDNCHSELIKSIDAIIGIK